MNVWNAGSRITEANVVVRDLRDRGSREPRRFIGKGEISIKIDRSSD